MGNFKIKTKELDFLLISVSIGSKTLQKYIPKKNIANFRHSTENLKTQGILGLEKKFKTW